MRTALLGASLVATALFAAPQAQANGRLPASNQIVFSPTSGGLVILRATYGLMLSRDDGSTWTFLCEDALGLPPNASEDPPLGLTATNALVAGLVEGLDVSPDTGCNWGCTGGALAKQVIRDVVVRPDTPHVVLALASTYVTGDADASDGSIQLYTQVFQSTDDGATWAPLADPIDPDIIATTLEVAASDPTRLYVSGTRGFGAARTGALLVWTGAAWTEHATPFDPATETGIYIGAVDPTNADHVYVRTANPTTMPGQTFPSRLLVTADGGATFTVAITLTGQMLGFALSPDGSKVYAGGPNDGLLAAASADLAFAKTSPVHVQCLRARAGELWACADEASGFVAGVSTDDGATFTPRMHLGSASAPIACAPSAGPFACGQATANASVCAGTPWQTLCTNEGCLTDAGAGGSDGGSGGGRSDAGNGDGGVTRTSAGSSCGFARAGGGAGGWDGGPIAGALVASVIAAAALRRRRRR